MSSKGNCYDNAIVESFFSTLKNELVHDQEFHTREAASIRRWTMSARHSLKPFDEYFVQLGDLLMGKRMTARHSAFALLSLLLALTSSPSEAEVYVAG
jgi:transposase InsO family protein